jgi:N-methylhydantoinase A
MPLDDAAGLAIENGLADLVARAGQWFAAEQVADLDQRVEARADLRYRGQNFELGCTIMPGQAIDVADLKDRFHEIHDRSYGFHNPDAAIEIVCLSLTALGRKERQADDDGPVASQRPEPAGYRDVLFARGARHHTPAYLRASLCPGDRIEGPAIIDQLDTTVVIQPGDIAQVDQLGNLVIEVEP